MKILRGIALGFWVTVMATCVGLVAAYYIASQTVLNPSAVKSWLNDSGAYASLTDVIAPNLTAGQTSDGRAHFITTDMVQRAAKSTIKPETVKAKVEPIIDATYAWLDSKSPAITFSVSTSDITDSFLAALRSEVLAKIKTLPQCDRYVAPDELETANCLPWYATPENATDAVMERIRDQEAVRSKALTPDSFSAKTTGGLSKKIPDLISYFWVSQLLAMPVFALIALYLVARRRGGGLVAAASSLLTPALALVVLGLFLLFGGVGLVQSLVTNSDFASVAGPVGKEMTKDIAVTTLQTGGILAVMSIVLGGLGFWWRKRARAKA